MLNEKETKSISKFLSWALRHHPEAIGINLDENGWTDVAILLEKANNYGVKFNQADLQHIVDTNSKKRFAFDESFNRIRASQGHSVDIELGYVNQKPPEILFHGTGEKSVKSILESGLEKRERQHVHLSSDVETAINVGQRHGKPYVFKVLAQQMYADNYPFYLSENGVWLTENVPTKYLKENNS